MAIPFVVVYKCHPIVYIAANAAARYSMGFYMAKMSVKADN
jgi:hypothetical protein